MKGILKLISITDREKLVLDIIKANDPISTYGITKALNNKVNCSEKVSWSTVNRDCYKMASEKIIQSKLFANKLSSRAKRMWSIL